MCLQNVVGLLIPTPNQSDTEPIYDNPWASVLEYSVTPSIGCQLPFGLAAQAWFVRKIQEPLTFN